MEMRAEDGSHGASGPRGIFCFVLLYHVIKCVLWGTLTLSERRV